MPVSLSDHRHLCPFGIVKVDDSHAIILQDPHKQAHLRIEIRLKRAVIIKVVLREVGKASGSEVHTIKATLIQPV